MQGCKPIMVSCAVTGWQLFLQLVFAKVASGSACRVTTSSTNAYLNHYPVLANSELCTAQLLPDVQAQGLLTLTTLLRTHCSFSADTIAVLLSNDKQDSDIPVVEAAMTHITLDLAGQEQAQEVTSSCAMTLHMDVYNNGLMGWEPLIEPWASSATISMPLTR